MELLVEKVINAILRATGIEDNIGRSQRVIRLLERFNLNSIESLVSFEDVYAHALVHYAFNEKGLCKPEPLISFFKEKEVRDVFQIAYRDNDSSVWLAKGQAIAQFKLKDKFLELEPKRELGAFSTVFLEIVKQTRSPEEIRQEHLLYELERQIREVQLEIQKLPSLEALNQHVYKMSGGRLSLPPSAKNSNAAQLAHQLMEWFDVLNYDRDPDYEVWQVKYFEWIISFPKPRRKFSRILVRGVDGEVSVADLQSVQKSIKETESDEGWLVGSRRISKAARLISDTDDAYTDVTCYTFDELLDEDADFSNYLDWLEEEIKLRRIHTDYLPLACRKDELDPISQQKIGVSIYREEDGWIDGYVDKWLDDPAKEHLSVLGEFGTGKTWFSLHYSWVALQRYKDAKKRGIQRPRIPILIPLRDYSKSVTVESLFSEFFFRKHEILKSYSAFEKLNRMGKLLLIFDGFDEMAARVNRQAMIDNFWGLARVAVPGAKAILTCRTEHFPDAMEGRKLLSAELKASTANLTGETPQFEVLELEKFSDYQIRQLLVKKTNSSTVCEIMTNPQLIDLARRPVMVELIIEALPDIESSKPIDMSRIY